MRWTDHLRVFAFFGLVWVVLLYWSLRKPVQKRNSEHLRELNRKLIEAVESVEKLRADNAELDVQLADLNLKFRIQRINNTSNKDTSNPTLIAPSEDYELLRRRIFSNAKEFSYYVNDQLKSWNGKEIGSVRRIYNMKNMVGEHFRSLLKDISNLADFDDHSTWRQQESENLSRLVQDRLNDLQNPPNCSTAKQLVCDFGKVCGVLECGFCCKLHHLAYCFIVAYETQRMLVLEPTNYSGVWPDIFIPLSNTCPMVTNHSISKWTGDQNDQIVYLPIVEDVYPKPRLLPPVLPGDFASRLNVLHGDPMVWWIGQFLKFILRPHPTISKQLADYAKKMNLQKPFVGVHIRRSDNINEEAVFHGLEEYMIHVEEYYKQKELSGRIYKKRIYLATDEPSLLVEARHKYPDCEILGDQEISKTAVINFRNLKESLTGLIIDIHFLSLSNYIVCTFSSQVCRVAYELMNSLHPDASAWYASLDDIYYFGGQNYKLNVAVLQHETNGSHEINLRVGDQIFVHENHWNGYSKGKNLRTKKIGLYPTFKAISKI